MKLGKYEFIRIKNYDDTENIEKALKIYKTNIEFFNLLSEEEGIGKEKIAYGTVLKDLSNLPPNIGPDKKYFGIIVDEDNEVIGVLDLIYGYPKKDIAYIGLFVIDKKLQRRKIGKEIIKDLEEKLKEREFTKIKLGVIKINPKGKAFWESVGFTQTKEFSTYIEMEKEL